MSLMFFRNMYDVSCFAGVCVIFWQIAGLHSLNKIMLNSLYVNPFFVQCDFLYIYSVAYFN